MAWAFVGISNVVEVTGTAHALVTTGITGLQSGDLLVACISSRIASTTSVTLPSGGAWTLVSEQKANNTATNNTATPSGVMAYAIRGGSDPNLTFTHPTNPSVAIGRIVAYRDVSANFPKDTQTSFTTSTNTTSVSGAGLASTIDGDLIVAMAAGGQEAAWSSFNATTPSGASGATSTSAPTTAWLERGDSNTTTGADTSLAVFDAVKTTTGATGNLTATASVAAAQVVVAGAFRRAGVAVGSASGTGTAAAVGAVHRPGIATWDPNDKSASITLSNSDRTMAASSTGRVRSTSTAALTDKVYFEAVFNGAILTGLNVGFASLAHPLSVGPQIAGASFCIDNDGLFRQVGSPHHLGSVVTAFANGDRCDFAFDVPALKFWVRHNGGDWNNVLGVGDPVAGTLGIDIAGPADIIYHAIAASINDSVTANFDPADFVGVPPTGYVALGSVAIPPTGSDGAASGTGAAAAVGAQTAGAAGAASSTGPAMAVGEATAAADGAASGTGTASGAGQSTAASDGSASGTGAATATAEANAAADGSATGTGAATAVATATAEADGASSGTGAATGEATATADAVGSADGVGAAEAVGEEITADASEGAGSASGTGTATGEGEQTAEAIGEASGTGTADAVGEGASFEGAGTAVGIGTANGVGEALSESEGSAAGVGHSGASGRKRKRKKQFLAFEDTDRKALEKLERERERARKKEAKAEQTVKVVQLKRYAARLPDNPPINIGQTEVDVSDMNIRLLLLLAA